MDGSQLLGIAAIITAIAGAYATFKAVGENPRRTRRIESKLDEVHEGVRVVAEEVHTSNTLKMGANLDAVETRRIEEIPVAERTEAEQEHIKAVPKKD